MTRAPTKKPSRRVNIVPAPPPKDRKFSYPLEDMEVNTVFVVHREQENSVRSMASRAGKLMGRTYTVRRLLPEDAEKLGKSGGDWVGVWRLK